MGTERPRPNNRGKPTIDDVASLAGVSRTTVSRVLNDGPNVRPGLREKVRGAVAALSFKVNVQARNLAGQNGGQIALVHQSDLDTEPNSYYHAALELGALRACAQHGFQIVTRTVSADGKTAKRQIRAMLADGWLSGIILTPPLSDDSGLLADITRHHMALVCIASNPAIDAGAPTIGIDDLAAGRAIARHLIALGHRRFGYIHGLAGHGSAERRFAGLCIELEQAGIGGAAAVIEERGTFTFHSGIDCAHRILEARPRPTCLLCANDDMAAGALLAIHRAGLAIPGDISVAGFDDTPLSEIVWPPLTTVHQPIKQMGQAAAELLIEEIMRGGGPGNDKSQRRLVDFHVVERDSTGAPPRHPPTKR